MKITKIPYHVFSQKNKGDDFPYFMQISVAA